ncbi:MAG TPA: right-handed parallel beta-helix repeat-containing protein, partial [Ilumatobacteraceae bacterium]
QLGEGRYVGPAHVPDGVTVRGLGPGRTVIDGDTAAAITLGAGSRVEHVTLVGGGERVAWFPVPVVRITGPSAAMLGCVVHGHVVVSAHRAKIRACEVLGVVARGVDGLVVARSRVKGMRWDVGIDVTDGAGHLVDTCEIDGHLCAIRFAGTIASTVRGCTVRARWWGVHLAGCDGTAVIGNDVGATMRAADVDGGTLNHVEGNVVHDGDSGCIVERGASQTVVAGNRWERCRIGLLAWDVGDISHRDNAAIDLHEPEHTVAIGPT